MQRRRDTRLGAETLGVGVRCEAMHFMVEAKGREWTVSDYHDPYPKIHVHTGHVMLCLVRWVFAAGPQQPVLQARPWRCSRGCHSDEEMGSESKLRGLQAQGKAIIVVIFRCKP